MSAIELLLELQTKYNNSYDHFYTDYYKFKESYLKAFGFIHNEERFKNNFMQGKKKKKLYLHITKIFFFINT